MYALNKCKYNKNLLDEWHVINYELEWSQLPWANSYSDKRISTEALQKSTQ